MNKASRDTRGARVAAGLVLAAATISNFAVAQPLPVDVTAAHHWVLYARLQGSEPFAVADGSGGHLWWFDAQGRPLVAGRLPPASPHSSADREGRRGLVLLVHGPSSADVARFDRSPSAPPVR